ncbi:MAG: ribosomal-processing cysteine protease Prp [Spirochaetales bacterium]|nr:ribosomal-processing cysteine protease Prp [Spirochaetales bacterium]
MILVTVAQDGCGKMESVTVDGHALGLRRGGNIVCAAVTILVRTAARLLEADPDVRVSGGPGERGEFTLFVDSAGQDKNALVKTVGDFLVQGLKDLQAEFPDDCTLEIR